MIALLIVLVLALVWLEWPAIKSTFLDNSMYCRHCGATLDWDTSYCHECRKSGR